MRRVISLWLPRFATDLAHRTAPSPDGQRRAEGLVLAVTDGNRRLVHAADAAALAEGIFPGMGLSDARAVQPDSTVLEADAALERRERRLLVRWCSRFTPLVADGGAEAGGAAGLWLDVSGCAHLFGGEGRLLSRVVEAAEGLGFTEVRAALAGTPGAAWALARFGSDPLCVLPADADPAAALAGLPIAALHLAPEQAADLARLGLRQLGELMAAPRTALAHRFDPEVIHRLDQALGRIAESISPAMPAVSHSVRLAFPEPVGHPEAIAAGLERLLSALRRRLELDGVGARRLLFQAYGVDGSVADVRAGAGRPVRDPAHWLRLFRDRLERIDPGFGLDALRLTALAVEPFEARQAGFATGAGLLPMSPGFDPAVEALIDRLANRLGGKQVFRLVPRESHWPERAVERRPAMELPRRPSRWPLPSSRPLRLLREPDAVSAIAASPAAPPSRFVWRRQTLAVREAEGPERIVPEWWRGDQAAVRDYWRIETTCGRRLWLARAPSPTTPETRWYVHGVFD